MNGNKKLALLSMALLLTAGCNEKVSPELQEAASSSTVPTAVAPSEYYFSVSNASSYLLNFQLHRTGSGNAIEPCEVRKTVPLTNELYSDEDPDSDISCYMDAEELALYFGGMSLKVDASQNTCEYVAYSPFSYYNRMPGDSSGTYAEMDCDATTVSTAEIEAGMNSIGYDYNEYAGGGLAACKQFTNAGVTDPNDRGAFVPQDDASLCRFNYTTLGNEQCDVGVITVYKYSFTDGTLDPEVTSREVECGGRASNCIRGPIQLLDTESTTFTQISSTTRNAAFSKTYDFPALISTQSGTTYDYVNFRRNLASLNINFISSTNGSYASTFSSMTDYTSTLMDRYSRGKKMDDNAIISTATYEKWSYEYSDVAMTQKTYSARPLAAEPFMGMTGYRTNPFYTFYCMDAAFDIKARIRIVVRDWDRVFPDNDRLEIISDIYVGNDSRQDAPNLVEIGDDQDPYNPYNDLYDWDDLIPMQRTNGTYTHATRGTYVWEPMDSGTYTDGFFNPALFPRYYTE